LPDNDKTEKATPKKRRDAREKGQVLKSTEVNIAVSCVAMFGLLTATWDTFTDKLTAMFKTYLSADALLSFSEDIGVNEVRVIFSRAAQSMLGIMLPILATALIVAVAANILQVGFMFTTKPLAPKLERINPLKGFQRIFSTRTLVELLKSILKISVMGYIAYGEYKKLLPKFPEIVNLSLYDAIIDMMGTALSVALKMCIAFAGIAAADYLYQWWKFEKDLMMTKQEVKDEYKNTEGDPQIKGRIRQKQRQMSAMRMMQSVPEADVVITNPTHYAVALRYKDDIDNAPAVVAKGADFIAQKIKQIAAEHGIEIVENKPLAQSLYAMCEVGDEIPAEFYQAVADILVFVYKQKNGGRIRGK